MQIMYCRKCHLFTRFVGTACPDCGHERSWQFTVRDGPEATVAEPLNKVCE
jgi:hypothetical protein